MEPSTHLSMSSCAVIEQCAQHTPSVGFDQPDSVLPETEKLISSSWNLENSRLRWQLGAQGPRLSSPSAGRGGAETIWQS